LIVAAPHCVEVVGVLAAMALAGAPGG
jgi:hypothetical protein